MSVCFTDDNIKRLYKSINVNCNKASFPLLRRLSNNYINYYLKGASMIAQHTGSKKISVSDIALVKKLNHETNVYHHTYKVERLLNSKNELRKNSQKGGGSQGDFPYPAIDLSRVHLGGGSETNKTNKNSVKKLSSTKGFSKQCQDLITQMEFSTKLSKDATSYLHILTENFLIKLALNTVALNKELKKQKANHIKREEIINALP